MASPPAKRTQIGYFRWTDLRENDEERWNCGRDYFVLPDGSAEVVSWEEWQDAPADVPPDERHKEEVTSYPPGDWKVEYPTTTFGSRGGCWIQPVATS
jgi:hypothetical protein